jgi:hypothetical protein
MGSQRFPIRIGRRSAGLLRLFFGVRPENAYVDLTDGSGAGSSPVEGGSGGPGPGALGPIGVVGPVGGTFIARFGWFRLETPIANIVSCRIEGPWAWITAIGVRRSFRHADVSFGGTPRGGVRVDFRDHPKLGVLHPPALYVTVDDLEGLASALTARDIPGKDARTQVMP